MANDGEFIFPVSSGSLAHAGWMGTRLVIVTHRAVHGADKKPGSRNTLEACRTMLLTSRLMNGGCCQYILFTNTQIAGDGFEALWIALMERRWSVFLNSIIFLDHWMGEPPGLPRSPGIDHSKYFSILVQTILLEAARTGLYTVTRKEFGGQQISESPGPLHLHLRLGLTSFANVEVSRANATLCGLVAGQVPATFSFNRCGQTFTAVLILSGYFRNDHTYCYPSSQWLNCLCLILLCKNRKDLMPRIWANWNDISGFGTGTSSTTGFPDVAVYSLYVRPDNPDIIWAGTEIAQLSNPSMVGYPGPSWLDSPLLWSMTRHGYPTIDGFDNADLCTAR